MRTETLGIMKDMSISAVRDTVRAAKEVSITSGIATAAGVVYCAEHTSKAAIKVNEVVTEKGQKLAEWILARSKRLPVAV
jgi:hypothetical protein